MKLATPEDVINYFYYLIPLNETVRARKTDGKLIIYDKYNNTYSVSIFKESQSDAVKKS